MARRIQVKGEKIDLSILSLQELLEQCELKSIIPQELYFDFLGNYTIEDTKQFLAKLYANTLKEYHWSKVRFTVVDHRRLAELLVLLYPHEYMIGSPYSLYPDVTTILKSIYSQSEEDYKKMYEEFDQISGLTWWRNICIRYNQEFTKKSHSNSIDKKIKSEIQKTVEKNV